MCIVRAANRSTNEKTSAYGGETTYELTHLSRIGLRATVLTCLTTLLQCYESHSIMSRFSLKMAFLGLFALIALPGMAEAAGDDSPFLEIGECFPRRLAVVVHGSQFRRSRHHHGVPTKKHNISPRLAKGT